MKVIQKCKHCQKNFEADSKETKRGNAIFCSISCSASYRNLNKKKYQCTCTICQSNFEATTADSKFCSKPCKYKGYRAKQQNTKISITTLQRIFKDIPCELCGWNETTRDIHHIVPVSKGGKNDINNVISVCPNHHRMIHKNLVSQEAIHIALKLRLSLHPEFTSQEQDAQAGY